MAARRPSIDLLAREEFVQRSLGRFLLWILTVGRYIVIFTELIVIAGFITRVVLDRNLGGVNEDLFQQKAILASYEPVERHLRVIDQQLKFYRRLGTDRLDVTRQLKYLADNTPVDVRFDSLSITEQSMDVTASALSPGAFALFLARLQSNPEFSDLILQSVKTGGPQDPTLQFSLSIELQRVEIPSIVTPSPAEEAVEFGVEE